MTGLTSEKIAMLEKRQAETVDSILKCLKKHHRCMCVRPTGFGKTYVLRKIAPHFKRILFVCPLRTIAQSVRSYELPNVDIMGYTKLANIVNGMCNDSAEWDDTIEEAVREHSDEELIRKLSLGRDIQSIIGDVRAYNTDPFEAYDLIYMDECHCAGSPPRLRAILALETACPDLNFCGLTASPWRSDGVDIQEYLFQQHVCKAYYMRQAFEDGILIPPIYFYGLYDVVAGQEEAKLLQNKLSARAKRVGLADTTSDDIKAISIEMSKVRNMPEVLKDSVSQYRPNEEYMKFISFYSSIATKAIKAPEVAKWLRTAFPEYTVRAHNISSSREDESIEYLESLEHTPGVIDLICTVDMLNMGYHVDDLTGLFFLRGTGSDGVYTQQVGRGMSVTATKPCLIYDLACNILQEPYTANALYGPKVSDAIWGSLPQGGTRTHHQPLSEETDIELEFVDLRMGTSDYIARVERAMATQIAKTMRRLHDKRHMPTKEIAKLFDCTERHVKVLLGGREA